MLSEACEIVGAAGSLVNMAIGPVPRCGTKEADSELFAPPGVTLAPIQHYDSIRLRLSKF